MDKNMSAIDRKEESIPGREPSQITPQKKKKKNKKSTNSPKASGASSSSSASSSASSEPPKTPGRERSEVNIEIKGFKESSLTPSKVTSNKVRTVFRSTSGSTSDSKENSPALPSQSPADDEEVFSNDISHKTPTEVVDGGVWYLHRKTSESHYISQQYNVDATTDSPSKSVTAIPHVTFKSRKAVSVGSGKSSTSSTGGAQSPCYATDHIEKRLAGSDSSEGYLNSPSAASSAASNQFIFDTLEDGTKGSTLSDGKLNSYTEDVQQIIQSSYMVSDITDVIDDDEMKLDATKSKSLPPKSPESSVDAFDKKAKSKENNKPANLTLDPKTHETSASRSAYSPGLAMRSYALEELEEKKSSKKAPLDAKSMRFDAKSSKIDIDSGSSVDTIDAQKHSKQSENASPFKVKRVNKVHLPEHTSVAAAPAETGPNLSMTMTEEERRESEDRLDSLVDISAIQAGYRFHDVGMMMMDVGGICNPAFDETEMDEGDMSTSDSTSTTPQTSTTSYNFSENFSATKPANEVQKEVIAPVFSSSSSSTLSTAPSSIMKSPHKQTPNVERNMKDKEVTEQMLPPGSESLVSNVDFLLSDSISNTQTTPKAVKKPDPVPFTRKFNPTKKFESSLKSLGATLLSESLIIDVYYDTESFDLTLNDSWLRTRNGIWQFHSGFTTLFANGSGQQQHQQQHQQDNAKPKQTKNDNNNKKNNKKKNKNKNKNESAITNANSKASNSNTPTYQEFEDVDSLISNLQSTINGATTSTTKTGSGSGPKGANKFPSVAAFVHRSGLREYVRYTSTQRSYELDGMAICLDMPQHGYWVGSVTAMAPCKASVHKGVSALDDFWNKTGVKPLSMMCA